MTTRYVYTSPVSGRKQVLGLAQVLHPEFADLGEASALTGNLLATLVDKGYLALYEALQIAGVSPETVSVVGNGVDAPLRPSRTPAPPFVDTDAQFQPVIERVHVTHAANAAQHKADVNWLIDYLRSRLPPQDLRLGRLMSFLREELDR